MALLAGVSTTLGGLLCLYLNPRRDLLFGFSGGLVVGLALLDLIPAALGDGSEFAFSSAHEDVVIGFVVVGFAAYLLLHRLPSSEILGRVALLLHSLMDGLAIGLAFAVSGPSGLLVAAAVLTHDMADGANMVGLTLATDERANPNIWLALNAIAPLLGVILGRTLHIEPQKFSLALALFAGEFLYLGTMELLPRSRISGAKLPGVLACIAGLATMGLATHFAH